METWSYDKTPFANVKKVSLYKTKKGKIVANIEKKDDTIEIVSSK